MSNKLSRCLQLIQEQHLIRQQSVEVIKEPASHTAAYPRNLISEHHKCFLHFEAFPISAQSYCLQNHFLLLDALQHRGSAVWKLDGISAHFCAQRIQAEERVCGSERLIFTQWLPYVELLTALFANTHTHRFMRCVSSCSLLTLV